MKNNTSPRENNSIIFTHQPVYLCQATKNRGAIQEVKITHLPDNVFFFQEDTRKKFSSFILFPLIRSGCRNKERACLSPCNRCCRVTVLFTTWFLPLSSRQQWHSRTLQTADFLTEVTFMCLNLILFPLPAGDSSPSKIPLKLITTDSSLLLKHSLSFYRRKFNIFELFTFFSKISPHIHTSYTSTSAELLGGHSSWKSLSHQQKAIKRECFY